MDLSNKKLVLVGGAGFIGSHIADLLLDTDVREIVVLDNFRRGSRKNLAHAVQDNRVRLVEGSITDRELVRQTLDGADGVFLLAALWLSECVADPRAALDVNVMGNYNVIEACRDFGVQRMVYSSSASVYGNAIEVPMSEEHPFNNRTMYGATKIAGEQILRAYNDIYDFSYVGLRYMNVYGPRMDYHGTYVSVIMKVLDRIASGEPPVIFGDGSQSYDFIHVKDIARANILSMQAEVTDEFFNIGSGEATTINELVYHLLRMTGSNLKPTYNAQEKMFVTHRLGTTEKAERLLGFRTRTGLEEGLKAVVDWRIAEGLEINPA